MYLKDLFKKLPSELISQACPCFLNFNSVQILIACDGIRSPVAKLMGFPEPNYVGHCAFRGLAYFPEEQPFEPKVNYIYGKGVRAGYVPVSETKVYWFICYNSSSPGLCFITAFCSISFSLVFMTDTRKIDTPIKILCLNKKDEVGYMVHCPCHVY